MNEFPRHRRVADELHRQLTLVIREHLDDPKITWVSITHIDVSRDLTHAKVGISHLQVDQRAASVRVLNQAAGFLRARVGEQMRLRVTPELKFYEDDAVEAGEHLSNLIEQARARDAE
ncbi:MAG: 30S ribosome-binding factor RbfA [Gammaproteobacteria bacterium]|nr:30S ribosome-binding factor RbfA [Gammaproteobacteria bacterium]